MAISRKLLNEGEDVVLTTRTHPKALLLPGVVLLVVLGVAGYLSGLPSGSHAGVYVLVVWVVAVLVLLPFSVWPFLGWLTSTYTVTNRRLITRTGLLTRRGHDIPLNRISDVSYERGLIDRLLGCGSLIISDASEEGRVVLHDIPDVEQAQLKISDQLFHGGARNDDGT